MFTRSLAVLVMAAAAATAADGSTTAPAAATTAPATAPAQVPAERLQEIARLYRQPSRRMARAELFKLLTQRMEKVLSLGLQIEKEYPGASDLHKVYRMMLPAADFLAKQRKDDASRKQLVGIASRLLASNASPDSKAPADYFVTLDKIRKLTGDKTSERAETLIRQMADRYRKTPAETPGLIYAAMAADRVALAALKETLLDELQAKHADEPGVRPFLQRHGRRAYVGATFQAELKRLDGGTLKLPDDLKGKVVLIDFWASWCGPCVASMPKLKTIYAKYKSQGLEIVGISLDRTRADAESFVKDANITWIQTYSGGANDPTAAKYGVNAIPSMWLVGRDGKIITNQARGRLDTLIPQALKADPPARSR